MPRSASLKARPTSSAAVASWLVNIPAYQSTTGRRERRFFKSKAEADEFGRQQRIRLVNYGTAGRALPPGQLEEAAMAFDQLKPLGVTLGEVVEEYVLRRQAESASVTLAEAFKLFEEWKPTRRSPPYIRQLHHTLSRFQSLGEELVASVQPAQVEQALKGAPPAARNAFIRVLRAVFNFAIRRGWALKNPVLKLDAADVPRGDIRVLTVEQARALFKACLEIDPPFLPHLAIGLFAGVRPHEMDRMTWQHIHIVDKEIKLPPRATKTRSGRTITMEPVLLKWLKYHKVSGGSVVGEIVPKDNQRTRLRRIRVKAGVQPWMQDVMRHSFASYWLKEFENKDRLLAFMGHTTDEVLIDSYLRAVDRKAAAKYWKICPPTAPAKVA